MIYQLDDRGRGFTLLETMIVLMVLSVVIAIAASALVSLSTATNRNNSMVVEEQNSSSVLAQLTEDIRSAALISFPSGASPSTQLELAETGTSSCSTTTTTTGSTSYNFILWIYSSTAGTLTREEQTSSCAWSEAGFQLSNVTNSSSVPVFAYFDDQGNSIPASTTSPTPTLPLDPTWDTQISGNATAVSVNLYISSSVSGASSLHQSDLVALTNQLQALNASGEGT